MNIFLVCPMLDEQSGTYIYNSLVKMGHRVAFFDWKHVTKEKGLAFMNTELLSAVNQLKPDITIIIKGLGITGETVQRMKDIHTHPIVGWIFDVTLGGKLVTTVDPYVRFIKELDTFYTIDNDAIPELKKLGVNAKWLSEGCHIPSHKDSVFNFIQKKKYGGDVVFLGSVGAIHPNREKILERLHEEGFDFKLYGEVYYPKGDEPVWVKDHHTGFAAINDYHSLVCNASKIVIGIDGWPDRDKAYSARLYRTLCAGGFLLTNATKGIEKAFTPGEHLDTYKTEDELVEKLLKYLEDDDLREKIGKAGQTLVQEKHTFIDRLKVILEDIPKDLNTSNDTYMIKESINEEV